MKGLLERPEEEFDFNRFDHQQRHKKEAQKKR